MTKELIEDSKTMYARGFTFYAIANQLYQWYGGKKYTAAELEKALKCKDNPTGHKKFKGAGW